KRAEGKRATAALLCLARRKVNLLRAMLRNGTLYRARSGGGSPAEPRMSTDVGSRPPSSCSVSTDVNGSLGAPHRGRSGASRVEAQRWRKRPNVLNASSHRDRYSRLGPAELPPLD